MDKNFDDWNKIKKQIEASVNVTSAHEREIWWVCFGINLGVEIDGKHSQYERPALVIKRFNKDMIWVLPITSQTKNENFHSRITFMNKYLYIAMTQVRTISSKRLLRKAGMISKKDFKHVMEKFSKFTMTNEDPSNNGSSRRPKP